MNYVNIQFCVQLNHIGSDNSTFENVGSDAKQSNPPAFIPLPAWRRTEGQLRSLPAACRRCLRMQQKARPNRSFGVLELFWTHHCVIIKGTGQCAPGGLNFLGNCEEIAKQELQGSRLLHKCVRYNDSQRNFVSSTCRKSILFKLNFQHFLVSFPAPQVSCRSVFSLSKARPWQVLALQCIDRWNIINVRFWYALQDERN